MLHWRKEEQQAIEGSDAVITVSDEIIRLALQQEYRLPAITHVYANYTLERFVPRTLPQIEDNTNNRPIRIVYEGFISNNNSHYDLRAIFQALATEGIEVHIYPSRDNADYQILADTIPNIVYHPSLAPERLFEEITQYDFGWAGFNDTLNRVHLDTVLPNKLFEYIACGLPVIGFQHKSLQHFLETHRLGLVIDTVSGLADRLRSPGIDALRENVRVRRRDFTVEANIGRIVNIYRQLCAGFISMVTKKHLMGHEADILAAYYSQRYKN